MPVCRPQHMVRFAISLLDVNTGLKDPAFQKINGTWIWKNNPITGIDFLFFFNFRLY